MAIAKQYERYLLNRIVQTVLVLVLVGAGFKIVDRMFVRWDLTEDQRFTISEASRRMARQLGDPLTIRAYFSANLPERYAPIARQVYDILAEYQAAGGGKVTVERYDPDESMRDRGDAENYGIRPAELHIFKASERSAIYAYGGIVMLYRDRASEVIDIAARYNQGYEGLAALEYEISSRIARLANEKTTVGLAGSLMREEQPNPMMPQRGGPQPEFEGLRKILGGGFEVESVDLKEKDLDPKKVPLLLLVRPKEMSEVEVFRLDQYLVKGGRVMLFVSQGTIERPPWGEDTFQWKPFKTGLDDWLRFQGLSIPNEFVLHYGSAFSIPVEVNLGGLRARVEKPNWFWPVVAADKSFDRQNPAIQKLKQVAFFWPHPVDVIADKEWGDRKATVLVQSHEGESWRWKDGSRIDFRRLSAKQDGPTSTQASPLVVAVEGKFQSYYAERGAPPSLGGGEKKEGAPGEENPGSPEAPPDEPKEPKEPKKEEAPKGPEIVKESAAPTQLVVVGNSVFVSDLTGLQEGSDMAVQATLLAFNLVDWLAGSADLIALRAKKYDQRRINDLEEMQKRMESIQERFEKEEIGLDEALAERDRAREAQTARRNGWRWRNILFPCIFVVVAGCVVWITRAALRARPAEIPPPAAPASHPD